MSSKQTIRSILDEGRKVPRDKYAKNYGIHHVRTFFFFCERLSQEPEGVALLSKELNDDIVAQLRDWKIEVGDSFNPHGMFGKAWTEYSDSSKDQTDAGESSRLGRKRRVGWLLP